MPRTAPTGYAAGFVCETAPEWFTVVGCRVGTGHLYRTPAEAEVRAEELRVRYLKWDAPAEAALVTVRKVRQISEAMFRVA
jgi:hypothetical protein